MKYFWFIFKVLIGVLIISGGYYFLYLKPHNLRIKEYSIHYSNLVQNRNAYINLVKLDENVPEFDLQRFNLIDIVRVTNEKGLEGPLTNEEKNIFNKQNIILEKVFTTSSYKEGLEILKSEESVNLLKDELDLINSYKELIK